MKSATPPIPIPRTMWLKTTDDVCEAPRARSPKTAEAKMNAPPKTRAAMRKASGLSIRAPRIPLGRRKCDDDAEERKDDRKHPVAHDHLVSRPTDRLEVMMQGRDA